MVQDFLTRVVQELTWLLIKLSRVWSGLACECNQDTVLTRPGTSTPCCHFSRYVTVISLWRPAAVVLKITRLGVGWIS